MLESLTIRNFAVIDELTVDFSPGLNIITGETGAGKSIVVDALELALGARSSGDLVRTGADGLSVSGMFGIGEGPEFDALPVESEEGAVILRREIRTDGSGRIFVNDRPVTLRSLRELGDRLVDLHGQHDHQSLLSVAEHVRFLDGFGGLGPLARETAVLYDEYTGLLETVENLRGRIESGRRDQELHRFQMEEIETTALSPDEDTTLDRRILLLSRAADLKVLGFEAFHELSEREGSVTDRLGDLAGRVRDLARSDERLTSLGAELEGLAAGASDLAREFRGYGELIDDDPASLAELESRLAVVEKIKKKYGPTVDDVLAYFLKISGESQDGERLESELSESEARCGVIRERLARKALELSMRRKEAGPRLSKEVEAHLAELGMSGARLVLDVLPIEGGCPVQTDGGMARIGRNGMDRFEFLIATNPGEQPRPLVKIASGGEVSRVMLALKLALAGTDSVPTMVFDEIDSGVSGRVAEAVGKKLRKLAQTRQTIVVTHLPQIAALADRHFSARKTLESGRSRTELVVLDREGREEEIATLLSGGTVTETARAHAREMLKTGAEAQRRKCTE